MSNQPPYGQGPWQQQPPAGPPPGQGPAGPPGPPGQSGPPQYGGPPPGGYPPGGYPPGGYPPPGGPGGPPSSWPGGGPPQYGGPPPGKSKLLPILAVIGVVIVLAGGGVLLYFLVLSDDEDDEASGGGGGGGGSNGGADYCTLLEENYDYFENMSSGEIAPDDIEQAVGIIHDLRDSAPAELADEWAQLDDPFRDLESVLDEEGLTWTDLDEVERPEDLPESVRDAAETFVNDLTGVDQEAVGGAIEDHAKDECGIDVEESPAP